MIAALRAEFRKLLTVRSTYFIFLIAVVLLGIFEFWALGVKAPPASLQQSSTLMDNIAGGIQNLALLAAITAVLAMTHEYRYNTVMYSLTASNSRTKFLLAKIITLLVYGVVFTLLVGVLSGIFTLGGIQLAGHHLVAQTIHYPDLIWQSLTYSLGYVMVGLLFAALLRNQVGAIAALFLVPGIVEQLLELLLKKNAVYLPFHALDAVVHTNPLLGHVQALFVFLAYLVGGWIIAWVLFLKRDAN